MGNAATEYLLYTLRLLALTLGTSVICGLAVHLCAGLFARLLGRASGRIFDVTAVIGTPVHELGHALMCLVFGHRIQAIQLWSPGASDGVYGYVEHGYNRKNPWAQLGNVFIALGPIFSGLGVTVLMLWLCFPTQWSEYLAVSRSVAAAESLPEAALGIVSLIASIPKAFASDWLKSLLGLLIILPVSLHISLSWQDIKSAASGFPIYLLFVAFFALLSWLFQWDAAITSALSLWSVRLLSLFFVVIAFSAVWVLIALLIRAARVVIGWF
jgi:hypothetical protein